jgi:hypothetical protein
VPINENFRGRSYGEWASEWWNWVLGENPDKYVPSDPLIFLRANNDYEYKTSVDRRINTTRHLDMTGDRTICIYEDTAIFFPVIEAELNEGDPNPEDLHKTLINLVEMRYLVRKDIEKCGPFGATIKHGDGPRQKIVNNLLDFRAESPVFKLVVPENSFLKDKMEWAFKPGVFKAVTDGFWILIRSLPASEDRYQIHFEANAYGTFYSATYDILVKPKVRKICDDLSSNLLEGFSLTTTSSN